MSNLTVLQKGLTSKLTLGTVSNASLASYPGREHHTSLLGTLGGHGGQVKREKDKPDMRI